MQGKIVLSGYQLAWRANLSLDVRGRFGGFIIA